VVVELAEVAEPRAVELRPVVERLQLPVPHLLLLRRLSRLP